MAGHVLTVQDPDFRSEVLESPEPVLVDFTAAWCGPCRALAPTLEAVASAYQGRVKVTQLDVDASPQTAQEYSVRSVPTLLFFKHGKVVGQLVGGVPRARLESTLQQVL